MWSQQWRGDVFYSHGTTKSSGVMTLIGEKLKFKLIENINDNNGRYITREGFLRKNIVAVSFFQNCAIRQYS